MKLSFILSILLSFINLLESETLPLCEGKKIEWKKCKYISETEIYSGEWKYGEAHGYGTLDYPDIDLSIDAYFLYGEIIRGTVKWPEYKYIGDLKTIGPNKNIHMHGFGELTFPNGFIHQGMFHESSIMGQGKRYLSNGNFIEGEWLNNSIIGIQKLHLNTGIMIQGYDVLDLKGAFIENKKWKCYFSPEVLKTSSKYNSQLHGDGLISDCALINNQLTIIDGDNQRKNSTDQNSFLYSLMKSAVQQKIKKEMDRGLGIERCNDPGSQTSEFTSKTKNIPRYNTGTGQWGSVQKSTTKIVTKTCLP